MSGSNRSFDDVNSNGAKSENDPGTDPGSDPRYVPSVPAISHSIELRNQLASKWAKKVALSVADQNWLVEETNKDDQPKIIVSEEDSILSPLQVMDFITRSTAQHVVQPSANGRARLNTAALMTMTPMEFLENPVSAILDPEHSSVQRNLELAAFVREFRSARQLPEIQEDVAEYLDQIRCPKLAAMDVHLIVDELVNNAILNAPYPLEQHERKPGFDLSKVSRDLPGSYTGKLMLGEFDNQLVIICSDPFGNMDPMKLLQRIHRCVSQGATVNLGSSGRGGAGIGSYLVFERGSSYFLASSPGKQTVVASVIPMTKREKLRALTPKSVHWLKI